MRLIDAEKLRAEYLGMPNCYNGFSDTYDKAMIVDMVDEQPTIKAIPVVRCRECKYWKTYQGIKGMKFCTYVVGAEFVREPEDYCSRGERKDDGF